MRSKSGVTAHRSFDPRRVGALECDAWVAYYRREWMALLQWWRLHREHQHDSDADRQLLVQALANLYAYVYGVPQDAVRTAAEQRVVAMDHSDRWVEEGRDPASPLVEQERAALVRSYAGLLAGVHR